MVKREAKCTLIQEGVKLKKNLRTGMTCLKCHRNTAEVFADCVINCTCEVTKKKKLLSNLKYTYLFIESYLPLHRYL